MLFYIPITCKNYCECLISSSYILSRLAAATPLRLSSFQLSAVGAPHLCLERAVLLSFVQLCFSAYSVFSREVEESPLWERLSGG
ncbi:hypothetical protein YC2023_089194 [Brassica napus]